MLAHAAPASAQWYPGMNGQGEVAVSPDSPLSFETYFALTSEQKQALGQLREAEQKVSAQRQQKWSREWQQVQEDYEDEEDMKAYQREAKRLQEETTKQTEIAQKEHDSDVKSLLTADQLAKWPKWERVQRRQRYLQQHAAELSGANVDLIAMYYDGKYETPSERLKDVFERYEQELDLALIARKTKFEELTRIGAQLNEEDSADQTFDPERINQRYKRYAEMATAARKASLGVRDVNDTFFKRIAEVLTEKDREAFQAAFDKAKFPTVYGDTRIESVVQGAKTIESVTEDQKQRIESLWQAYQKDVAPLNKAWAAALAKVEADGGGGDHLRWYAPYLGQDGGTDPGVKAARKARRRLDRAVKKEIFEIVGPDRPELSNY